ncbi:Cytochrome P450 [Plasmopara halstedii]|uniref:Cytochrome P450 n=1 Tax=Plasmopara halstedii TaxID=4781 RepID=A0A0P1B2A8_PLAHL|nr:Cytochrome P450 [Plasmopara halstedii]CEG48870.1 Cytochrome P450 [Plasmopara halstedii]|eukprot:XP_024585239.1 Cytochrome P450 [Plasmopara halstedii]
MKAVSDLLGIKNDVAITVTTAVAVSVGLTLLVRHSGNRKSSKYVRLPPMPSSTLPILKNILDVGGHAERFHDWLNEQSIAFDNRPWLFSIPGRPSTIVLSSAEFFEDVLVLQDDVFLRGPVGQFISYDIFGNGMVISDGDPWYYHRKTASHLFSMQMMREVMELTILEKVSDFLDVLDIYSKRGQSFSMKKELSHFTMDAIAKIGFGIDMNTLKSSPDREDDHEFLNAFNEGSVAFGVRIQSPLWLWRLKKFLNVGWEKILMKNTKIMHEFISKVIVDSINKKAELAERGETMEAKDLITLFLDKKLKQTDDMHIEDDDATIMRDMVMTFVFAGKDSTAHSMGWFIVNMNRYPDVLHKIREEIMKTIPGLFTGEIKVPTQTQIRNLVYLEAVVKENIRLHPSTGFIVREAMQDTTLIDGTFVKKGQTIMLSSYCNARNKKMWGEDALEFKPERMIDPKTGKLRKLSPYMFSSFGSGQHACIGQKFAMMQIKLTMATLFSMFDIKTVEDPWKLTYEFSLTIPVKGSLDVKVTPYVTFAPAAT